jgi:hypothetical protein
MFVRLWHSSGLGGCSSKIVGNLSTEKLYLKSKDIKTDLDKIKNIRIF